jgi:hypothetical protein
MARPILEFIAKQILAAGIQGTDDNWTTHLRATMPSRRGRRHLSIGRKFSAPAAHLRSQSSPSAFNWLKWYRNSSDNKGPSHISTRSTQRFRGFNRQAIGLSNSPLPRNCATTWSRLPAAMRNSSPGARICRAAWTKCCGREPESTPSAPPGSSHTPPGYSILRYYLTGCEVHLRPSTSECPYLGRQQGLSRQIRS